MIPIANIQVVNFQNHVLEEMSQIGIEQYFYWGGELNELAWRTYKPQYLKQKVETVFNRLIGI